MVVDKLIVIDSPPQSRWMDRLVRNGRAKKPSRRQQLFASSAALVAAVAKSCASPHGEPSDPIGVIATVGKQP
jgi:hypothetical protein